MYFLMLNLNIFVALSAICWMFCWRPCQWNFCLCILLSCSYLKPCFRGEFRGSHAYFGFTRVFWLQSPNKVTHTPSPEILTGRPCLLYFPWVWRAWWLASFVRGNAPKTPPFCFGINVTNLAFSEFYKKIKVRWRNFILAFQLIRKDKTLIQKLFGHLYVICIAWSWR